MAERPEEIRTLLNKVDEFIIDFAQSQVLPQPKFFLSCLRASLAKCYEFLQFVYNSTSTESYFFSISTLRGITEDLIVLGFISRLEYETSERLLVYLQFIEQAERVKNQQLFFEKYRSFQPVITWNEESESLLKMYKDEVKNIWRTNGWPNFDRKNIPPVRELAKKIAPEALDLLYDFIYRLTSSTVHFSSQALLRLGWGNLEDKVTFSVKHLPLYYEKFCQIYGALLFCLYFELFEQHINPNSVVISAIAEIRKSILSANNRWPEMITFEEMNMDVPQFDPDYEYQHSLIIEKFRHGFLQNTTRPDTPSAAD
ncbi:MAG: DUF5677 domain-containing protein [Cyanobacteriota bacterium]